MTSKPNWICSICGHTFTRNTSGKRHNVNLHSGLSQIVYSTEYYVGIVEGKYQKPVNPPATFRRKKTLETNPLDVQINAQQNESIFNSNLADIKNNIFYDIYYNDHTRSKDEFLSNNFFFNNAAKIDSMIEEYQNKLQPFQSKEIINQFIKIFVIIPLCGCSFINTKEEFDNYKRYVDNMVGILRTYKRI